MYSLLCLVDRLAHGCESVGSESWIASVSLLNYDAVIDPHRFAQYSQNTSPQS